MPQPSDWRRTHRLVPRENERLLADPPLAAQPQVTQQNARQLATVDFNVQGRPFQVVRSQARQSVLQTARRFTAEILQDSAATADADQPLIVTGHQPSLYHVGVWAKNFAADSVARNAQGHVLNLVVDNDLCTSAVIDVPGGNRNRPTRRGIAFDENLPPQPWEARPVVDSRRFAEFGATVARAMSDWNISPLIESVWPNAVAAADRGCTLYECLTAVRHAAENRFGLHHLEVPMSAVCETQPFSWFMSQLLAGLPKFAGVHNAVLADYRKLYGLKSRNHPVPELEQRGDWFEAPFWVWRDDEPRRRRLFARTVGWVTELADSRGNRIAELPLSADREACCAVEVLQTLPAQGIRIRTRALTTTLFARLFLSDLFVHGIGGSKYDEMTDRIIERYYGLEAPAYATVSASLFLPFASPFNTAGSDVRRLATAKRDLRWNPQRHLTVTSPSMQPLLERQARLIADQKAAEARSGLTRKERAAYRPENKARYQQLHDVTRQLAASTLDSARAIDGDIAAIERELSANRVLKSREFSFVLYPEQTAKSFLTRIAADQIPGDTGSAH